MSGKPVGKFKAALLNFLGVPAMQYDNASWWHIGGASQSGKTVDVQSAMQLSATWACVRLISETVSTLPLKVYERMPDGSRQSASQYPLYDLLCRAPNADMTPSRFMGFLVTSVCLWGNAYVEKKYIGGRLVALIPLKPQCVILKRNAAGGLDYEVTEDGKPREILEKKMMHIRGFGLDGMIGLSTVAVGRDAFGAAMAADEASGKMFSQGMQSSGFLSTSERLNDRQREQFRKSLTAFSSAKNAGKLMVLEAGMTYQGITMNPEAAQMLQTRAFGIEEICRLFRVPPFMIGHLDKQSSWASSVEGMNLQFLSNTLRPLLVNIEQEIARCLIPSVDFRYFVSFSVEGLLRGDADGRAKFYNSALNNGWMTRNEVRQKEDMPPVAGGDVCTVQSALIPVDQVGTNYSTQEAT